MATLFEGLYERKRSVNKYIDIKLAKAVSVGIAIGFLLVHAVLLVLFCKYGVMPMVYFGAFSIVFYLVMLWLIKREYMKTFVVASYLEVILHMTTAVYFVGWNCGFQVTLIGLSVLAFLSEYVGRATHIEHVPGLPLSIIGGVSYLIAFELSIMFPTPYSLPNVVEFWMQIGWAAITFIVNIASLQLLVLLAFNSEVKMFLQASHDQLTGLPNRYQMSDYLNTLIANNDLEGRWAAMIDIDDFKRINDTYGHTCGDDVLKGLVAAVSTSELDAELCRWGGEEFLVVGKTNDNMAAVYEQLDRMRLSISEYGFWFKEKRLHVTATIGLAAYEPGDSIVEWINKADKKLYEGKRSGKNKVVM